jgi:hypothetical protein
MRLIQEAAAHDLIWRQPSAFKEQYELRADEEVLATLQWKNTLGTLATARTAEGAWTFKRGGFWQQRIVVRPLDTEHDVATFVPNWSGGGVLTVAGGRTFHWSSQGFLRLEKHWQEREDGPPLVGFKQVSNLKNEARLTLSIEAARLPETVQLDDLYLPLPPEKMTPPAEPLAELPLLVTLGFYLLVLAIRDAAASS